MLPFSPVSALAIVTAASVGVITHCGPAGGHAGGVVPGSCTRLAICATPGGSRWATVTTTLSTRLPAAGPTRPLQVTTPAAWALPLAALTNTTCGSSRPVTP